MTHNSQTTHSGPHTAAGAWGLRYPGLVMGKGGKNEVSVTYGIPKCR